MSHHLTITNQTRAKIDTRWLSNNVLAAVTLVGVEDAQWAITIVGDRAMKKLHTQTMNDATTTDVLTFDLRDAVDIRKTREGVAVDLDTVLCYDEAARRAKELGHKPVEELLLYAIHSLLHVQGYDDVNSKESARMHRREDALLLELGLTPLYAAAPAKSSGRRKSRK